jgi:hypothetical protein
MLLQLMQTDSKRVKKNDYDGAFLKMAIDEAVMYDVRANIQNVLRDKDGDNLLDASVLGSVVSCGPRHMYMEVLLTQVLNILEFLDSQQSDMQEKWQELANKQECVKIANNVGQIDNLIFIKTIRNSIGHARYIKDNENIYFYDGDKDNVQYKFSVSLNDLEEIKRVSMKYVEDYINNYNLQNLQMQ